MKLSSPIGQWLAAFLTFCLLLADVGSAVAIPDSDVALSSRDALGSDLALSARDAPYVACTPQGAGSCNLGFEGRILGGGECILSR